VSIPVPSIDPPPHPVEVEARGLHATACRQDQPGITGRQILDAWDALPDDGRRWLLETAQRRMEARLAEPAKPDDVEALTRRLTGMSPDEVRALGAALLAEGEPTHPRQDDDDGAWYDVPCDCRLEPVASTPEELAAAVERLRTAGPVLDRLVLGEPPEHRVARQRTGEEQAALTPPRVGRWVVGQGWVPVDGLGPYEGVAR
jgi:hypothetical protein